jgi:hypothetical protein
VTAADLNKEIAMKIYHVVSVYKAALVDGTNNSDQHKLAVSESDEQKFGPMGSPKLERIRKHGILNTGSPPKGAPSARREDAT